MATKTDTQSTALQVADSHDLFRVHGARIARGAATQNQCKPTSAMHAWR
jgi:hypothetical protein